MISTEEQVTAHHRLQGFAAIKRKGIPETSLLAWVGIDEDSIDPKRKSDIQALFSQKNRISLEDRMAELYETFKSSIYANADKLLTDGPKSRYVDTHRAIEHQRDLKADVYKARKANKYRRKPTDMRNMEQGEFEECGGCIGYIQRARSLLLRQKIPPAKTYLHMAIAQGLKEAPSLNPTEESREVLLAREAILICVCWPLYPKTQFPLTGLSLPSAYLWKPVTHKPLKNLNIFSIIQATGQTLKQGMTPSTI